MRRNLQWLKNGCVVGLFLVTALPLSAQNKPPVNPLANFEKSIKQGKIAEIERPLLNYAVTNPNDAKALELLARIRFQQNRLAEAEGLYRKSLTLDPRNISVKISYGRTLFALGKKEEARRVINEVAETSTVAPTSQFELAAALFFVGEIQKSLVSAEKLSLNTKNNEVLPLLAAIYLESGNHRKLQNLIPQMKRSAGNAPLSLQSAEILQNAGMNKDALDILRATLISASNNVEVLTALGRLEIYAKDYAAARRHLEQARKLQPNSAEILAARALLEISQENLPAAFDLLSRAREIAPNSTIILADFVILAMRSNRALEAVKAANSLVSLNPANPEYQYLLGAALLHSGNIMGAREVLEKYAVQRPNDSRGCLALGLTLAAQRDQIENARQQLNRCLEIDPQNYEAQYQLGLSYKAQGETEKAIALFEKTVKIAPDYAPVLRDLGALYLQSGSESKAQSALEKSAAVNPNDADTHFQLSRLYNLQGKSELARQQLEMFQKIRNGGKITP